MKSHGVGTLAWEMRTGGKLSRLDRLTVIAAALRYRLLRRLQASGITSRDARRIAAVDLSDIRIPDTRAARDVLDYAASVSPDWLFRHCVRSYLFGALLGRAGELRYDDEMLYVASLLHDLGLTRAAESHPAHCFAVAGARAAEARAEPWQWPAERRQRLRDAIALHTNITVPIRPHGVEAHLLNAGAGLDVTGARARELSESTTRQVLERYPRGEFAMCMAAAMQDESHRHPAGRIALYERFGFSKFIAGMQLP